MVLILFLRSRKIKNYGASNVSRYDAVFGNRDDGIYTVDLRIEGLRNVDIIRLMGFFLESVGSTGFLEYKER